MSRGRRPPAPRAEAPSEGRPLNGLGALGQVWKDHQRELERRRAEQARRESEERERQRRHAVFRQMVGPVTPLPPTGRMQPDRLRPSPHPRSRERDEQAVLQESLSDDFDVESLLETDADLAFRRPDVAPDVLKRLRRGQWSIQGEVDLHGLRRDEAREALGAFLREAGRQGWRCVRVVHGKGLGSPGRTPVLKAKVRSWLVQKNEVLAFVQARADEGGAGALVVLLQPLPAAQGGR